MVRSNAARRLVFCFAIPLLSAPMSAAPPEEIDLGAIVTGQPPGVRQTERLAKRADALIEAISTAQGQVRATMSAYDELLLGTAADLRKPYRAFDKEITRLGKARETVRKRADEARAESTDYFRAWAGTLPLIDDNDLRARSELRLRDSRSRFDSIVAAGSQAATLYEPLVSRLRDQWNYLGHDLNPSGIESLRPDAERTAEEGRVLLSKIDESLLNARDYVRSIRSRQPPPPPAPEPEPPEPGPEPAPESAPEN